MLPDGAAHARYEREIAKGEILTIIGPSGAGKTMLNWLYVPDAGTITIDATRRPSAA